MIQAGRAARKRYYDQRLSGVMLWLPVYREIAEALRRPNASHLRLDQISEIACPHLASWDLSVEEFLSRTLRAGVLGAQDSRYSIPIPSLRRPPPPNLIALRLAYANAASYVQAGESESSSHSFHNSEFISELAVVVAHELWALIGGKKLTVHTAVPLRPRLRLGPLLPAPCGRHRLRAVSSVHRENQSGPS